MVMHEHIIVGIRQCRRGSLHCYRDNPPQENDKHNLQSTAKFVFALKQLPKIVQLETILLFLCILVGLQSKLCITV